MTWDGGAIPSHKVPETPAADDFFKEVRKKTTKRISYETGPQKQGL